MSKKYAMWVHGHAVQPEKEGYHISKQFAGGGATFRTYGAQYFHFAIPTPVLVANARVKLEKVFVFYKTTGTAKIRLIDVMEVGWRSQRVHEGYLSGDHSRSIDSHNSWSVSPPHEMRFGLGITIRVEFGDADSANPGEVPSIHFTAAGADFFID